MIPFDDIPDDIRHPIDDLLDAAKKLDHLEALTGMTADQLILAAQLGQFPTPAE